jgi:uncharacterized protein (TIGR02271 family)
MTVDYDYEERVRHIYRTPNVEASGVTPQATVPATYDRNTYTYDREPSMYQMSDREQQTLKLYEERLIADKHRRQTGEVAIGKRVETDTAQVSVPVEKERVVIERRTPQDVGTVVTPGNHDFREGEVAHMRVYEETADIRKQAFVREEVTVRKEVERDTVDATETLRREELEVDVNGKPVVEPPH